MTITPVFNSTSKERYIYRIKIKETGEYCMNHNNEPCECGTKGWADVLMSNCKMKYPGRTLILVKEAYNVKH